MTKTEKQTIINLIEQYKEEKDKADKNYIDARKMKEETNAGYFLGLSVCLNSILLDLSNLLKGC